METVASPRQANRGTLGTRGFGGGLSSDDFLLQRKPRLAWLVQRKRKADELYGASAPSSEHDVQPVREEGEAQDLCRSPMIVARGVRNRPIRTPARSPCLRMSAHNTDFIPLEDGDVLSSPAAARLTLASRTSRPDYVLDGDDESQTYASSPKRRRIEVETSWEQPRTPAPQPLRSEPDPVKSLEQELSHVTTILPSFLYAHPTASSSTFEQHPALVASNADNIEPLVSPPTTTIPSETSQNRPLSPSSSASRSPLRITPFSSPMRSRTSSPVPARSSSLLNSPAQSPLRIEESDSSPDSPVQTSLVDTAPPPRPVLASITSAPKRQTKLRPLRLRPPKSSRVPPPWCKNGRFYNFTDATNKSAPRTGEEFYRALGQEINDFADWVAPTVYESKARNETLIRLSNVIHALWPHAGVYLFGSSKTQLCISGSDLDLVVTGITSDENELDALYALAEELRNRNIPAGKSLKVIHATKVPIIKLTDRVADDRESLISVDICFNNTSGPQSSDILIQYVRDMPLLRPLALVLKYFMKQQNINEPFEGGMGSYLLVLLLIHLIQKRKKRKEEHMRTKVLVQGLSPDEAKMHAQNEIAVLSASNEDELLGQLFMDFFIEVGFNLNYSRGISVRESGSLFDKSTRHPFWENPYLAVEDPENREKDVGRGCWNIESIRRLLKDAFYLLVCMPSPGEKSILSRILSSDFVMEEKRRRYEHHYSSLNSAVARPPQNIQVDTSAGRGRGGGPAVRGRGRGRGRGSSRGRGMTTLPPNLAVGTIADQSTNFYGRGRGGYRPWRGYYGGQFANYTATFNHGL